MQTLSISKQVPVAGAFDVVVCGGGPSGFIAAIAAARGGARTAMIERYGFAGGMATAGFVAPISVFSYNGEQVIGGIPWEFVKRLEAMGGAEVEQPLHNVAFDPELYKLCAQRMLAEAGVTCFMHSYLSACQMDGSRVTHAVFENKNGTEALSARVFIDATGDADLAHMAGVPMQPVDGPLQPASFCFRLEGVDTNSERLRRAMHHGRQGSNSVFEPAREALEALRRTEDVPNYGGPWVCSALREGSVMVNMTRTSADACDNRDFCAAEASLREDVFRLTALLRRSLPEFANCYVAALAPQAGMRETRRILGAHTITAEEYLSAYRYEDSVSRGAHPIDVHVANDPTQHIRFLEKAAYVPYRALYAEAFPNLLAAGRCLSADRQAFASLRVQASAMGAGQAAGMAAALCARESGDVRAVNVTLLQERLRAVGTVI